MNNLLSQQNVSHIFTRTPVRGDIGNFKEIQAEIKIKRYALLIFQLKIYIFSCSLLDFQRLLLISIRFTAYSAYIPNLSPDHIIDL
jgi:hypothetical protein